MARQLKEGGLQKMATPWWPSEKEFETLWNIYMERENKKVKLEFEKTGCFRSAKEHLSRLEGMSKDSSVFEMEMNCF